MPRCAVLLRYTDLIININTQAWLNSFEYEAGTGWNWVS